jgi:NAD(P)-dependent dehydrogenase (short-subunit alcohol dehydrogenase family)
VSQQTEEKTGFGRPTPPSGIAGMRAVITAGAGGAGRVIAETLADMGCRVVVCDVDSSALNELRRAREDIVALETDASQEEAVDLVVREAEARFGGVDLLVNNVGIAGPTARVEDISRQEWDLSIATNLTSHFLFARRVIPGMKARRCGLIVNISSGSAKVGLPLRLPYVVSKGAVLSLTLNLARELGPHGIRVNALLPGAIRGARIQRVIEAKADALGVTAQEYEQRLLKYISLRTMIEPGDIAAMVAFLASPAGARITGQAIGVDGNIEYEE